VSWGFPVLRAVALGLRGPAVSMGVRLFPAVHGHIADRIRDHVPGRVAGVSGLLGAKRRTREQVAPPSCRERRVAALIPAVAPLQKAVPDPGAVT
jgi:hypothetical protein